MASVIDISGLTMNPLETQSISEFILQRVINDPQLQSIHNIWSGITMKSQITLASQLSKTGIKDSACTRPNSGAESVMTEKYWEPAKIGDTLVHCQSDVDALFKAYYTKIKEYQDLYDLSGSELETLLTTLMSEASLKTIWRTAWFGDTAVAAAAAGAAGLIAAADVQFYDQFNGLWKQIFAGVVATTIEHTTTKVAALNAQVTKAAQTTLAAGDAVAVFKDMLDVKASTRLRQRDDAQFLVSRELFDNYKDSLKSAGENFTIEYTMNGLPSLKYDGRPVVNMESVWLNNRLDFVDNTTNNAYYLPNRAVLTTPDNIPVGTLNDSDFGKIENWFNQDDRVMKTAYGFTLDSKVIDEDLIVAAY